MHNDVARHRKLVRIEVVRLLGRFDHILEFDPDWNFLIIHGPNGIGKTKLLELLDSVFSGNFHSLIRLPFESVRLEFDDVTWVEISRESESINQQSLPGTESSKDESDAGSVLIWRAAFPGSEPTQHRIDLRIDQGELQRLARFASDWSIERIDSQRWIDRTTGEEIGPYDLAARLEMPLAAGIELRESSPALDSILRDHQVHLIQTQRLLRTSRIRRRRSIHGESVTHDQTVLTYATDLSTQLKAALAENSRRSQELDRSFPSRLFSPVQSRLVSPVEMKQTELELRKKYDEQLLLRSRLAEIDILDKSLELSLALPPRDLESWELSALNTYLEDTDRKLQTFQSLLNRLELLREIVDNRFLFKRLEISQEIGFAFRSHDSKTQFSPADLSSGEQHQLVLMYDLLMNVSESCLVLIDEPEISLHIDGKTDFWMTSVKSHD